MPDNRSLIDQSAPLCGCGLPQSRNPHPDAGKPNQAGVEVGYVWQCIPCLVKTRNRVGAAWRAEQAKNERLRKDIETAYLMVKNDAFDAPGRISNAIRPFLEAAVERAHTKENQGAEQ